MTALTLAQILFSVYHLIRLTGPDHQMVLINPDEVVSLREPRSGEKSTHFAPGTSCLIFTADGKYTAVMETCSAVRQKLEQLTPQEE